MVVTVDAGGVVVEKNLKVLMLVMLNYILWIRIAGHFSAIVVQFSAVVYSICLLEPTFFFF